MYFKEKLQEKDKSKMEVCIAVTNVLLAMSFQFSNLENLFENVSINSLTRFIPEGSFKHADVFTSSEFVFLCQGIPSVGRSGLDDRFYFLRRVLKYLQNKCGEIFWQFLNNAIVDKIVEIRKPFVFAKSLEKGSSPNIIVTPGFRESNSHTFISAFNSSWTFAAHLYSGFSAPEIAKPVEVYGCFQELKAKERSKIESGLFIQALEFTLQMQTENANDQAPKIFDDLPEQAKAHITSKTPIVKNYPKRTEVTPVISCNYKKCTYAVLNMFCNSVIYAGSPTPWKEC
jgi:hypothetical protein